MTQPDSIRAEIARRIQAGEALDAVLKDIDDRLAIRDEPARMVIDLTVPDDDLDDLDPATQGDADSDEAFLAALARAAIAEKDAGRNLDGQAGPDKTPGA